MRRAAAVAAVTAGVLLLGVTAFGLRDEDPVATAAGAGRTSELVVPETGTDALTGVIARAQEQLEREPTDAPTWAVLGSAYVEQARVTADPSYYPLAEGALDRSLQIQPEDNDAALTARGALANARHDFADAAELARSAQAVNDFSSTSYGVLADALIQLGDYDGATAAAQRMLDLRPGLSSFTRGSYDLELHGDVDGARTLLERALAEATAPADAAFCRTYLGQLAFSQGDLDTAGEQFRLGLEISPDDPGLLLGAARVEAARGNSDAAVAAYQRVVELRPLPEYLVEHGQLLESLGRTEDAEAQYAVFAAAQQLFESNGVRDSLAGALLAANRGDGASAVEQAEQEWAQRQNIDSADALGWALHVAGRSAEALAYAQQATALGTRNASFLYHRGAVEQALGMDEQARATLSEALAVNPYFSPVLAPRAEQALAELGGPL